MPNARNDSAASTNLVDVCLVEIGKPLASPP